MKLYTLINPDENKSDESGSEMDKIISAGKNRRGKRKVT